MSEEQRNDSDRELKEIRFASENRKKASGDRRSSGRPDGKHIVLLAAAAVVLLCFGMFLGSLIGGLTGKKEETGTANAETGAGQELTAAEGETEEQKTEEQKTDVPLEENAYPAVNELMEKYFRAAAEGDLDTINTLRDYTEQTELLQIREKSRYLEGYEDINCYTKPGPVDGSYIVYVSYYARFIDMEKRVCGLNTFVVCTAEDGSLYIHDCTEDEDMKEYRTSVTRQDDVVELFNRIQVEYNEAVTGDEELAAFLAKLSDDLKAAVGDALAQMETASPDETADESAGNADGDNADGDDAGEQTASPTLVKATDVVNIRRSDSEAADVLGKAAVGDEFTLLENRGNGWSKIEYNGQEAFIKSDYLVPAEENTEALAEAPAAAEAGPDSSVPDSGNFRLSGTVNIRKSASETADRLAVAYSGDVVEILMKQADGWTKVKFEGKTGYIKTEVLK